MRVFGCAWKINFPEVIWSWLCKMRLWPRKWFEVKIFNSNHFQVRRAKRERERERERERGRRGSLDHAFDVAGEPWAPVWRLHAPDCTGLIDHNTASLNLAFDLASARSCLRPRAFDPPIFNPPISFCDFDFCCCCGGVVVVFWWLWLLIAGVCCRRLNWSFGGVWGWDLTVICSMDWDLAVILKVSVIKFVWMLRK